MNKQYYTEFLKTLLSKRQIPIQGEIDRECFERVNNSLMYLNAKDSKEEIKLLINSSGGNVGYGLAVYDAVISSLAPVTAIVTGPAHSMAAVIVQGCTRRIATFNSNLCIHNISARVEISLTKCNELHKFGELDVEKLQKNLYRDVENLQKIGNIISTKSKLDASVITDMSNSGKIISAEDALKLNLIDEIINKVL